MLLVASPMFAGKNITDVIRMSKRKAEVGQHRDVADRHAIISAPKCWRSFPTSSSPSCLWRYRSGHSGPDRRTGGSCDRRRAVAAVASQGGALKALAVTSTHVRRWRPDIPTSAEAGMANLLIDAWICFMGTGGAPLDHRPARRRNSQALAQPEVREAFAKQGVEVMHMGPGPRQVSQVGSNPVRPRPEAFRAMAQSK